MTSIAIDIYNRRVDEALRRLPGVIETRVDLALDRGSQEFVREARSRAPKARSALVNSILSRRLGEMHYEVSTGVNYARAVEEGTGPAVGKASYMPNPLLLQDYVKQRGGIALQTFQVERTTRFGPGARFTFTTKWLNAHHRAHDVGMRKWRIAGHV